MTIKNIQIKKLSITGDISGFNITNAAPIVGIAVGDIVYGQGIPSGTRIVNIIDSTLVMSNEAIISGNNVNITVNTDNISARYATQLLNSVTINGKLFNGTSNLSILAGDIPFESLSINATNVSEALNQLKFLIDDIEVGLPSGDQIISAILPFDGAGSGLDADLLDGQNGSYYLDYNNLTNIPEGSTVNSGALSLSIPTTSFAQSGKAIDIGNGIGFNANSLDNTEYTILIGPALTALATLMDGATANLGRIVKSGQNTFSIDNEDYLTEESDTLQTVTARENGNITDQQIFITNTTESTDIDTGSLVVSGGAAISKNVNIGGEVSIDELLFVGTDSVLTGDVEALASLSVGSTLTVEGETLLDNNAEISGDLEVLGTAIISNSLTAKSLIISGDNGTALSEIEIVGSYIDGESGPKQAAILGPEVLYIDPKPHDSNNGTVVILGNLDIRGTTTTINAADITIEDKNIILAYNAESTTNAAGAGILIGSEETPYASLTYHPNKESWLSSLNLELSNGKYIEFNKIAGGYTLLKTTNSILNNTIMLPDNSGTVALISDLPHAMTDEIHTASPWKLFVSNEEGNVTEISFGSLGKVLKSNGVSELPTWEDDIDTWLPNTQSTAGYVSAGLDSYNKVWKTDGFGNPGWRDEAVPVVEFTGLTDTPEEYPGDSDTKIYFVRVKSDGTALEFSNTLECGTY